MTIDFRYLCNVNRTTYSEPYIKLLNTFDESIKCCLHKTKKQIRQFQTVSIINSKKLEYV